MLTLTAVLVGVLVLSSMAFAADMIDGRSLGLIGVFLFKWAVVVYGFMISPIPYLALSRFAAVLLLASGVATVLSYTVIRSGGPKGWPAFASAVQVQDDLSNSIADRRLTQLIRVFLAVGGVFFLLYYARVLGQFGALAPITDSQPLRLAIRNGTLGVGLTYVYFFELLPALIVVRSKVRRCSLDVVDLSLILTSFAALFMTTGRTNVLKAALWCFFVVLFASRPRLLSLKRVGWIASFVVGVLLVFAVISGARGIGIENSPLASTANELPSWFRPFALPYHYLVGSPAAFGALVEGPVQLGYGENSFNSVARAIALFVPGYEAPANVAQFVAIPYDYNLYTHLDVMLLDFGVVGPVIGSAMLGIVAASSMRLWLSRPADPGRLLLCTWFALVFESSTGSAAFAKVSYLVQLVAILWLVRVLAGKRTRLSRTESSLDPTRHG